MGNGGVSGKLLAAYIIQATLYLVLCLLAPVGFWAAWRVSVTYLPTYTWRCDNTAHEKAAVRHRSVD